MAENVLNIVDLDIRYAGVDADVLAVAGVDLTVAAGETVGLVGESGCGKSSVAMAVMRHLGRYGRIARGTVRFRGADLAGLSDDALRHLRGNRIAMVYQDPATALNPTKRVGEQLLEVLRHHGDVPPAAAMERVTSMLTSVRLPDPDLILRRYPYQLSGGQQQRVVIAMAFLTNPDLLLLDEPTTALDVTVEREIVELLAEMQRAHRTAALFISHNLGLVRRICERMAVMYAGQIVEEGPVESLFASPRHPYTRGLLACLPSLDAGKHSRRLYAIRGRVTQLVAAPQSCSFQSRCDHGRRGLCDGSNPPLEPAEPGSPHRVRCFRHREIPAAPIDMPVASDPGSFRAASTTVLSVDGVTKHYDLPDGRYVAANRDVTFDLAAGETLAVVGESGSGKSTLGRIVIGLDVATQGKVMLHGKDVGRVPTRRRARDQVRAVQMIFQNPDSTLNPAWTVGRILARALAVLGGHATREDRMEALNRLLRQVRLPAAIVNMIPAQLSGGQKQRVAIARAFAGSPAIVVADEPTSALDTSIKTAVLELLLQAQQANGTALIFISHDLAVVRYAADRVIVMHAGEIVEIGPTDAVFAPPYHPYTEVLLSAIPVADATIAQRHLPVKGEPPSLVGEPRGCAFASRCPHKLVGNRCDNDKPPLRNVAPGHAIRCHISVDDLRQIPPVFSRLKISEPDNRHASNGT
ncbi:MAG: ABC transporter ATP-binding protein [Alphaproteobacteria bacterium]|nr:ABC transporter ATP-binding protein [Alphaproteobacteria bacterium]